MYRLPASSKARPYGPLSCASFAGPAIAGEPGDPGAGDGRQRAGRIDLPHAMSLLVGEVDDSVGIDGDVNRGLEFEPGLGGGHSFGRSAVPERVQGAAAGDGGDHPRGVHTPDEAVVPSDDVQVPGSVDGPIRRAGHLRLCRRPAVAGVAAIARAYAADAGHGRDDPVRRDQSHDIAAALRDVDVSPVVQDHSAA
jgi:hypothetical protein